MKSKTETPEFGIKRENEERRDGGCGIIFNPKTGLFAVGEHTDGGFLRLFSGGVEDGEDIEKGVLREVLEESGLYDYESVQQIAQATSHYYNSLKKVNRVAFATCFLIIVKSDDIKPVELEDHEKFFLAWKSREEILLNWRKHNQNKDLDHWFYFFDKALKILNESGRIAGY